MVHNRYSRPKRSCWYVLVSNNNTLTLLRAPNMAIFDHRAIYEEERSKANVE